jgi:hypothetical protein
MNEIADVYRDGFDNICVNGPNGEYIKDPVELAWMISLDKKRNENFFELFCDGASTSCGAYVDPESVKKLLKLKDDVSVILAKNCFNKVEALKDKGLTDEQIGEKAKEIWKQCPYLNPYEWRVEQLVKEELKRKKSKNGKNRRKS